MNAFASRRHFNALADRVSIVCRLPEPSLPGAVWPGVFLSAWKPDAEKMEKVTESIKLHLPERMKRDVQDAAMFDDRKVSDWIRHVLAQHLYVMKGSREMENNNGAMCPDEGGMDG